MRKKGPKLIRIMPLLLMLSLFPACQKTPDPKETEEQMTQDGKESASDPGKAAEEGQTEEGAGSENSELSGETGDASSDTQEQTDETETESEAPKKKSDNLPLGWKDNTPAAVLYRRLERSDFEKGTIFDGKVYWRNSSGIQSRSGYETWFYLDDRGIDMAFRRSDGSGIVLQLSSAGYKPRLLIKTDYSYTSPNTNSTVRYPYISDITVEPSYFSFEPFYSQIDELKALDSSELQEYYEQRELVIPGMTGVTLKYDDFPMVYSSVSIWDKYAELRANELAQETHLKSFFREFVETTDTTLGKLDLDWTSIGFADSKHLLSGYEAAEDYHIYYNPSDDIRIYTRDSVPQEEGWKLSHEWEYDPIFDINQKIQ